MWRPDLESIIILGLSSPTGYEITGIIYEGDWRFLRKNKKPSSNSFLVTADVVGLYSSILHDAVLKAMREKLEERSDKKVLSADLADMAELVLRTISLNLIQKSNKKSLVLP